ncbi:MAG: T9SS type A sorting domain-containing protein [Bacteroidia bacterium]
MTQKLFTSVCCCFLLLTCVFAQRGSATVQTFSDSIVGFQLDSLSKTHAYLSWGTTKRVRSYSFSYQADSVLNKQTVTGAFGKSIAIPRTRNSSAEIWSIRARYIDGTISPRALILESGITITIEEVFVMVNDHCHQGYAADPSMNVFFQDLCIIAEMNVICQINQVYWDTNKDATEPMSTEAWTIELMMLADIDNSGVVHVLDCEATAGLRTAGETEVVMQAYPNPVNDLLRVDLDIQTSESVNLRLTDLAGRSIYEQTVNQNGNQTISIRTADLAPGIYTLQVRQGANVQTQKIIKR